MDSNVTSALAYLAPAVEMLHVVDLLCTDGAAATADSLTGIELPQQWCQLGYAASQPPPSHACVEARAAGPSATCETK